MLDKVLKFAEKRAAEIFVLVIDMILVYSFFGTIWAIGYIVSHTTNIFAVMLYSALPACMCIVDVFMLYWLILYSDDLIKKLKEDLS